MTYEPDQRVASARRSRSRRPHGHQFIEDAAPARRRHALRGLPRTRPPEGGHVKVETGAGARARRTVMGGAVTDLRAAEVARLDRGFRGQWRARARRPTRGPRETNARSNQL